MKSVCYKTVLPVHTAGRISLCSIDRRMEAFAYKLSILNSDANIKIEGISQLLFNLIVLVIEGDKIFNK